MQNLFRPAPRTEYSETHIEIDNRHPQYSTPIDVAEREYRERLRPQQTEFTVDGRIARPEFREDVRITEETVEPARYSLADQKSRMGYYDEDGKQCSRVKTIKLNV